MLNRVTIAAISLLLAAAKDIPANRRALEEGSAFLSNTCEVKNPADSASCRSLQDTFLLNYLRAMSGDTLSLKNMASYFSYDQFGIISTSNVTSCAWAILAQASTVPSEDGSSTDGLVDAYCHALSDNDTVAAKHLADVLGDRIDHTPTRPPHQADGDGWPGNGCDEFRRDLAARGEFAPPHCRPGRVDPGARR
jgi:hypothetical protein